MFANISEDIKQQAQQIIDEFTQNIRQQAQKELAQKFYELSEEWGGGVAFYKQARKLCKECGVDIEIV